MFEHQLAVLDAVLGRINDLVARAFQAWRTALLAPLPSGLRAIFPSSGHSMVTWPQGELATPDNSSLKGRIVVDLTPGLVFWTETTIPKGSRWGGERAVALRMQQLSPIPPTDAVFALEKPTAAGDDRLQIRVGITLRKTLTDSQKAFPHASVNVTALSPTGQRVTFHRGRNDAPAIKQILAHPVTSVAITLVAFLAGAQIWWDREAAQFQPLIREEAGKIRTLETLSKEAESVIDSFRLVPLASVSTTLEEAVPDGSIIEKMEVTGGSVLLEGFLPSDSEPPAMANQGEFNRLRTRRPGWDQFSFRLRLKEDT